jgi:hypothetical protein
MSNRNISWEVKADGGWLTILPPLCADWKSGSLNLLEPSGPVQAYAGITLPFTVLPGLHVEYPLLSDFNETSIFRQIFEKYSNIRNLGASTSWNPQGLSRTVMGLLFAFYSNIKCHENPDRQT